VTFAAAEVTRPPHGRGGQVDATDERRLGWLARVDDPALLMLAIGCICAVPADAEPRSSGLEQVSFRLRAWESTAIAAALRVRARDDDTDVETSGNGAVEHVEERTATVREAEIGGEESYGQPDAVTRTIDYFANSPKCRDSVDKRPHDVARSDRVGTGCCGRHLRLGDEIKRHFRLGHILLYASRERRPAVFHAVPPCLDSAAPPGYQISPGYPLR